MGKKDKFDFLQCPFELHSNDTTNLAMGLDLMKYAYYLAQHCTMYKYWSKTLAIQVKRKNNSDFDHKPML